MTVSNKVCRYRNGSLMRVDYYGEELIGCIDCNRWGYPGDKKLTMKLQEHDLEALRARVQQKHRPH